ncbi:MAG TPA: phenylalanine--tRNA ligase beta subunit-related protein [Thermoleophilaceae bacterium]|nr:phenylalanine--tRNA ligase beta subunit-related protein [Thermoleophilaceae bacterium]
MKVTSGWIDAELASEFPQLALHVVEVGCGSGKSPPEVRERLKAMSDRYTGGRAVQLRQEPVPWAYRVFFRQVGLDPDESRTPAEALALARMQHGGFKSANLLDDAIAIATVETGVPIVAFDADRVGREIGLRLSRPGERLGEDGRELSVRQLLVADEDRSIAVLFGDMADGRGVHPGTRRMLLCAVQVKGVPQVSVEEALWTAVEVITGESA